MRNLALWAALLLLPGAAAARSPEVRAEFVRSHPCPSTGSPKLAHCPGWIMDHVIPLCAGGADSPANMQWQTVERSKVKDKLEVAYCKCLDRAPRFLCAPKYETKLREFK